MALMNSMSQIEDVLPLDQDLIIDGKVFNSRLMLGTGKYRTTQEALSSIVTSQASMVTVAVRRLQNVTLQSTESLISALPLDSVWLLPNTAGCTTVQEAIRVAALGYEICQRIGQLHNKFVKLEVISDSQYLLPDPVGTLKAAEYLVNKGYSVLPYMFPDPILAKHLEEVGCSSVMPLASPIGSGQGLQNIENLQIIIDNASVPVIVDAGIGTSSDAVKAIEMGASAVLVNSAIALSQNPVMMAKSIQLGVHSGRYAYLARRMDKSTYALPSSPSTGVVI